MRLRGCTTHGLAEAPISALKKQQRRQGWRRHLRSKRLWFGFVGGLPISLLGALIYRRVA